MARKVNVAVFDNDLRVEILKREISDTGNKIRITSGGTGNWKPSYDNDSFLEFPYRSLFSFWKTSWRRIYFVKKRGKKCVNFNTGEVKGPDPEDLEQAIGAVGLNKLGNQKQEIHIIFYIIVLILIGIALKVFGAI